MNDGTSCPKSIICFIKETCMGSNKHRSNIAEHPTTKPVALFSYLIATYTNENMLVLDNCMGSGTTAVACKQLNRNFIGIELNKEYVDIANKRLCQSNLFHNLQTKYISYHLILLFPY